MAKYDYFVVFAEMRTGSNFLETNLNSFADIQCHGEAFNPAFIGYPNKTEILGITQAMREGDPGKLIETIKTQSNGMGGFRYFHDHDPRVFDLCMNDPRCAKIVLLRNPLDSYVSWKIAQETGQWKLTNVKRRKDGRAEFDPSEFRTHLKAHQEFQVRFLNRLQSTGQTAFYIAYEDLHDLDVINGIAKFLGTDARLDQLDASLKPQNPKGLDQKVSNFDALQDTLPQIDTFNIYRTPVMEPRRGAAVPNITLGLNLPLMYLPVMGGPVDQVRSWMAAAESADTTDLPTDLNQKQLRQWKRQNPGHRSFTVLRHPLARAHAVYCEKILPRGPDSFADIRKTLRNFHKLPIPAGAPEKDYDLKTHRDCFVAFLEFLGANLSSQTSIRIDPHWASQSAVLQGIAQFTSPDLIIREHQMAQDLPHLAQRFGAEEMATPHAAAQDTPFSLSQIYDKNLEKLCKQVYQRDYMNFGFGPWDASSD